MTVKLVFQDTLGPLLPHKTDLSLSSHTNFFRGPITLFPGFSSSSSSDPFFSASPDCCLRAPR